MEIHLTDLTRMVLRRPAKIEEKINLSLRRAMMARDSLQLSTPDEVNTLLAMVGPDTSGSDAQKIFDRAFNTPEVNGEPRTLATDLQVIQEARKIPNNQLQLDRFLGESAKDVNTQGDAVRLASVAMDAGKQDVAAAVIKKQFGEANASMMLTQLARVKDIQNSLLKVRDVLGPKTIILFNEESRLLQAQRLLRPHAAEPGLQEMYQLSKPGKTYRQDLEQLDALRMRVNQALGTT